MGYGRTALGGEAFHWDAVNGMQRLQDVLIAQGDDLSHWNRLVNAYGTSGDGQWIVGFGFNSSNRTEAFLAQVNSSAAVPEPSTLIPMIALSAGMLLRRRRRQSRD